MDKEKLKNVGRKTVRTGMDSSGFDGWCWKRFHICFVLSMITKKVRKMVHSIGP